MIILEAQCGKCGETFNPHREDELEHFAREDGTECGGTGAPLGEWWAARPGDPVRYTATGLAAIRGLAEDAWPALDEGACDEAFLASKTTVPEGAVGVYLGTLDGFAEPDWHMTLAWIDGERVYVPVTAGMFEPFTGEQP